ncbi:MAG: hypothetical protein QOI77_2393 [Blastocatellia bacterium]|jgi:hypothetical protein|nr:hypothetical protein [Blastocatellia bacterium]
MRAMATLKPKRNVSPDDFRRKFLLVINFVLACTLVFVSSCGGSLFKVKPAAALPPMPATVASANLGSISFRAAPLLTDEESQELFESNLQLAGLLPVRIEISRNGGDPIELKRVHFLLTDAAGTKWKMISAKQAIAQILKANDVFAYNPASRKTFEQEFRAYELNLKSPLTHNEGRRQGFIIFLAPGKAPVSAPRGLVLTIEGLSQTANLKLN